MKTMTCRQLGGACGKEFQADSFDEIAEMSKQHGIEMFQSGDQEWFENKKKEFEALPDN